MNEHLTPPRVYLVVFAALLVLLALTVAVALVEHPVAGLAIALAIASAKALLIGLYFMNLRWESPVMRPAAVAGLVWLALLMGLSLCDLMTRGGPPATVTRASAAVDD